MSIIERLASLFTAQDMSELDACDFKDSAGVIWDLVVEAREMLKAKAPLLPFHARVEEGGDTLYIDVEDKGTVAIRVLDDVPNQDGIAVMVFPPHGQTVIDLLVVSDEQLQQEEEEE